MAVIMIILFCEDSEVEGGGPVTSPYLLSSSPVTRAGWPG